MMQEFDVVILGGGPAGAGCALALCQNGFSVLLIERSKYDAKRIGETLPPAIRKLLNCLGVWDQFLQEKHCPAIGTFSAWGQADLYENASIYNPYGTGWHVDRTRFDAMLASAAE